MSIGTWLVRGATWGLALVRGRLTWARWGPALVRGSASGRSSERAPRVKAAPVGPPLHRYSVGFPVRGRDAGQGRSVHLSGGTPDRAVPPQCPRPHRVPHPAPSALKAHRARSHLPHTLAQPVFGPRWRPSARAQERAVRHASGRSTGPAPRNEQRLAPFAEAGGPTAPQSSPMPRRTVDLPPAHTALICVALPGLAISTERGQLTGQGLEGFYRAGRRMLSRCQVRVAGREPLAVQARMVTADRARFVGTLRASPDAGPDPDVVVERTRYADGTERITCRAWLLVPASAHGGRARHGSRGTGCGCLGSARTRIACRCPRLGPAVVL